MSIGSDRCPASIACQSTGTTAPLASSWENIHSDATARPMSATGEPRARVFEQLFFHASGLGPAFGQAGFFKKQAAEPQPLAIARFEAEAARTAGMLDLALSRQEFVAGDSFSLGRAATFAIFRRFWAAAAR